MTSFVEGRWWLVVVALFVHLVCVREAFAQQKVEYGPAALLKGELLVGDALNGATCTIDGACSALVAEGVLKKQECNFWKQNPDAAAPPGVMSCKNGAVTTNITLARKQATDVKAGSVFEAWQGKMLIMRVGVADAKEATLWVQTKGGGWKDLVSPAIVGKHKFEVEPTQKGSPFIITYEHGGVLVERKGTLEEIKADEGGGDPDACKETAPIKPAKALDEWCNPGLNDVPYLVCVDLINDEVRVINSDNPGTLILQPNKSTRAIVQHPDDAGTTLEVVMQGDPRLHVDIRNPSRPDVEANADTPPNAASAKRSQFLFAPRAPGSATITVTRKKGTETLLVRKVELVVERTYIGALRFGIGSVFAGATDMAYESRAVSGAAVSEVTATSGGIADFEVVVGAAPFIFDLPAGRGEVSSDVGIAPYLGFGLISVSSGAEISFLKSIHLGLELEFAQNFSLAGTFVIRRVDRLPDDLQIGSPLAAGDVPTTATIGMGPGIVINVTPDLLKVVGKGPGGLLN